MKIPESIITRFFSQKGTDMYFEIQCANKCLLGVVNLASGMFKLEHCSFNLTEAIDELKIVHAIAWHAYETIR